jgi:hypothetical protein
MTVAVFQVPPFPNSIWERNCPGNSVALSGVLFKKNQREIEFRWEQGAIPKWNWGTRGQKRSASSCPSAVIDRRYNRT